MAVPRRASGGIRPSLSFTPAEPGLLEGVLCLELPLLQYYSYWYKWFRLAELYFVLAAIRPPGGSWPPFTASGGSPINFGDGSHVSAFLMPLPFRPVWAGGTV